MTKRILAVDDEPHMLKLLERIVTEKTSYKIVSTSNSLEVPDILSTSDFELIITDLRMPGLDGMDILRYLRENDRSEELIIITAFGSAENAFEAVQEGVFDYITKPFRKEQIIFAIDRAMRCQSVRREANLLKAVFRKEPFADAQRAFEIEYVRRLAQRCTDDREQMISRSGLEDDFLTRALQEIDKEEG